MKISRVRDRQSTFECYILPARRRARPSGTGCLIYTCNSSFCGLATIEELIPLSVPSSPSGEPPRKRVRFDVGNSCLSGWPPDLADTIAKLKKNKAKKPSLKKSTTKKAKFDETWLRESASGWESWNLALFKESYIPGDYSDIKSIDAEYI
jgi:hypothetical protein